MTKKRLNLTEEERRLYNNKMHYQQEQIRKQRRVKEAYKEVIRSVAEAVEEVGWDKMTLLLGPEDEMLDKVADCLIEKDTFKITFGQKMGIKVPKK